MKLFRLSLLFLCMHSLTAHAGAPAAPKVVWKLSQPLNAWITPPTPEVRLTNFTASPWEGFLRVERFDLLTEKTDVSFLPVSLKGGAEETFRYETGADLPYGVYRVRGVPVLSKDEKPAEGGDWHFFSYAPAKLAKDLSDDWPLGIHIVEQNPQALPGFKWYRYFSMWAYDNPARGKYDWDKLDKAYKAARDIGGRLVIANDSAPSWSVAPERVAGLPWVKNATAYPPDDWNDLRNYLDTLVARYDDGSGTLAVLEVWNEPNTKERWLGTHEQMAQMAQIFREAAAKSSNPPRVFGMQTSAGDHFNYMQGEVKAGLLDQVDGVGGHWYEEIMCFDRDAPISNLTQKANDFKKLVATAKRQGLPIWNSESGISITKRENGRLVPQEELNNRAENDPAFDPKSPWVIGEQWRPLSERRTAATYIGGTLLLMSQGVEKTMAYTSHEFLLDDAPSLPWVAYAVLGDQIARVNYRKVTTVPVELEGSAAEENRAAVIRLGDADAPGLLVAFTYRKDSKIGRSKHWQPWQEPLPVRIPVSTAAVEITDIYGRKTERREAEGGFVTVMAGEEPVYVREIP